MAQSTKKVTAENYYQTFDADKQFERIMHRDGYVLQGRELNDVQEMAAYRLKSIADALFSDGDVIRDAQVAVNAQTGEVQAQSGAIYLSGAVRGVAPATFIIPTTGTVSIGVRLKQRVVSELEDLSLRNPAKGTDGEGEPGAWRLAVETSWGFDGDGEDGDFFPVHTVDDGVVRAKEQPPNLDSFNTGLARYDRDSTGGGSYIASGMKVLKADDAGGGAQVYTVSEGRCRVCGYGVELPTSRRLSYAATPDLRRIDTEVHTADGTAAQRVEVAHAPIYTVESLRVTIEKTVQMVHGSYTGSSDAFDDTSVVSIVKVQQGDTVYEPGTDYKKTGDKIDWSPMGNEPATGSTYTAIIHVIASQEPAALDQDGFTVNGAVDGSSILVTYQQALPRLDRLCITQDGAFVWVKGVASESNPKSPAIPETMLAIATVTQSWRPTRAVSSDGVRVISFSEIEALNRRLDYIAQEVARQRLEADVTTRENGARVGMFVDPLLNDDMRDQGIEQNASIIDGELTLPIAATAYLLSQDLQVPAARAYSPQVVLAQTLRTGAMAVNPYSAFDPMPARVTLAPSIDRWTETKTEWTSAVTRRFETWIYAPNDPRHGQGIQSSGTTSEKVSSMTVDVEYLRAIDVSFKIEGFGPGEVLQSITFDGVGVAAHESPLAADANGTITGTFTIPEGIPAGAKTVSFAGGTVNGSRGSAVFVGQGELTIQTMRQVNTITTVWIDPLAQTFVLETDTQICGVDLWFTASGGDARVQLREVSNGVPTRVVLAEAHVPAAAMVVTGGGHTRVQFATPIQLTGNTEYALVVMCDDAQTALAIAEIGKFDNLAQTWVVSQPYTVGVMLSSSNASTWTAHQDKDLAFRLLKADFTAAAQTLDLGYAEATDDATDMLLMSLSEMPTAATRVEYKLTMPNDSAVTVADGQPLRLSAAVRGRIGVKATLAGDKRASPVLYPGNMLVCGKVSQTADYYTRSITARGARKAVLIYDAVVPSGATVTPELRVNGGVYEAMTQESTTQQGDGLVEFHYKLDLVDAEEIKAKLTLTGTSTARPRVSNIRLLAVS